LTENEKELIDNCKKKIHWGLIDLNEMEQEVKLMATFIHVNF